MGDRRQSSLQSASRAASGSGQRGVAESYRKPLAPDHAGAIAARVGGTRPGVVLGLLNQLAASPATVPGTPPNSPTGVSWPPWPTAQPNSFCASGGVAYT